jgi:hypothetical protein
MKTQQHALLEGSTPSVAIRLRMALLSSLGDASFEPIRCLRARRYPAATHFRCGTVNDSFSPGLTVNSRR